MGNRGGWLFDWPDDYAGGEVAVNIEELKEKKVAILGLGVNNQSLAAYLLRQRINVTVRDRDANVRERFERQYPNLAGQVEWEIGEGVLRNLTRFGTVFRTPSIPYLSPELQKYAKSGGRIYSQTKLFFDLCPAPIIGVSGTNGKGTTATLIHRILSAGYHKGKTYLAGNIGEDPFTFLDQLQPRDAVILELSSFQLQDLHRGPQIAVLLKVTSDHLNHHKTEAEYREAKRQMLLAQEPDDYAIVNAENRNLEALLSGVRSRLFLYGKYQPRRESAWVDTGSGEEVLFVQMGGSIQSFSLAGRKLRGEHHLENIIPAVMVACLYEVDVKVIANTVLAFAGLPHRLSLIGSYHQTEFYDDSIATTPEPTLAALHSFPGRRIHLIVGGNEKGQEYGELAEQGVKRCATISLLPGSATKKLSPLLKKAKARQGNLNCLILDKARPPLMETVLSGIHPHLQVGDLVLLSPAATSFASYANYKERGDDFIRAVRQRYEEGA
ncbi:UDP-N-acetylmuramoyl-L-alanine--D-glutamate ligase [Patescibacteria group bacterium]|nr:UDP-N-acetylmuramoyl-L-alanine--D-glutamate ligase [Patescibacteria group bacterium]